MTSPQPLHIILLATAASPWRLIGNHWMRFFLSDDENLFVLIGPSVDPTSFPSP